MAVASKKLAFVQLSDSKADIYVPSEEAVGHVHNILLCNTNTSDEEITLYMHDGTNEYKLLDAVLLVAGDTLIMDFRGEGLVVDASSKLTGNAQTAAKVTCSISGSEVS